MEDQQCEQKEPALFLNTGPAECSEAGGASSEPEPEKPSKSSGRKTIEDLPNEVLQQVFGYLRLEDIVLHVRNVSTRWRTLAEDSWLFRDLHYRPPSGTSEDDIIKVLQLAPKLRWLFLPSWTPRIVRTLCYSCKDIRSIRVDRKCVVMLNWIVDSCCNIECLVLDAALQSVFPSYAPLQRLKKLSSLHVVSDAALEMVLPVAAECPRLEKLILDCFCDYEVLSPFMERKGAALRGLSLVCCYSRTQRCLFPLVMQHCTGLWELRVRCYADMTKILIQYFSSAASLALHTLRLVGPVSGRQLAPTIFTSCQHLRSLHLVCEGLEDESLSWIYKLKNLRHLEITSEDLTDTGVRCITCSHLTQLFLHCSKLTERSFEHCLRALPQLHEIEMRYVKVSSALLFEIPNCLKHLKWLLIQRNNLEETIKVLKCSLPYLHVFEFKKL